MGRGVTPVVGVLILLAITVLSAATIGLVITTSPSDPPPTASFTLSVDGESDKIELTHLGGEPVDLTAVSVRISVDGQPLSAQPPVPFFSADGYKSGPTGAFNRASPDQWSAGESASLVVASTNDPDLSPGDTVRVNLYTESGTIADLTDTA